MGTNSVQKIPKHLARYLVQQNYKRYTPEDHAVWRFIMRELTFFLNKNAHPSYKTGLKKTGILLNKIPSISSIDKRLKKFGWRAGCVSGFIPPAAFMELQAHGILPIATEMRRIEHLDYTPAPDIVHEAAGHAPLLSNKNYSHYLKRYAEIANRAIITKNDLEQYEAIRELSDLKERSDASPEDIGKAYERLKKANEALKEPTEAVLLSRMAWWTTEYGLIGDLHNHKIFGAGLLSSVGESRHCLSPRVNKIHFSKDCTNFPYDITDPQPQLFVTKDFNELEQGLDILSTELSYKRGGEFGLKRMLSAETVNTIELCSGLQISGVLKNYKLWNGKPAFLQLSGPCQLAYKNKELKGHGKKYHSQGYGTPIGIIKNFEECLSTVTLAQLKKSGIVTKNKVTLEYDSGIQVRGFLKSIQTVGSKTIVLTFLECTVQWGNEILFQPEWGDFDLGVGCDVVSVFGGPADREKYGAVDSFVAKILPTKKFSVQQKKLFKIYDELNKCLDSKKISEDKILNTLRKLVEFPDAWLPRFQILELARFKQYQNKDWYLKTRGEVLEISRKFSSLEPYIQNSLQIIEKNLKVTH